MPSVPAHGELDRRRPRRQSLRHRGCHAPDAAPCRASARCASISRSCTGWAASCRSTAASCRSRRGCSGLVEQSADRAPERKDEPYRRAIVGIYARLAATAWSLDKLEPPHPPVGPAPVYEDGGRSRMRISRRSTGRCRENGSADLARGRLRRCGAPSMSSASISHRSTCGRTPTCHAARRWRSCWPRPGPASTTAALDEDSARGAAADRRTRQHRGRWPRRYLAYGDETAAELDVLRVAADAHRRYGARPPCRTT